MRSWRLLLPFVGYGFESRPESLIPVAQLAEQQNYKHRLRLDPGPFSLRLADASSCSYFTANEIALHAF